jgi:hypothetical protein
MEMNEKSIGLEKPEGGLEEGIQSVGDVLTQRQRKRFKTGYTLLGRYHILGKLGIATSNNIRHSMFR